MHVLLIHQAFVSPEDAGGTRHYELARRSAARGHRFTFIASDLNPLTGAPVHRRTTDEGIAVRHAWTLPALHRSFAWRVGSFVSFMVSSAAVGLHVKDVDVVIGTSPPLFQGASAWLVSALRRRPFLLEIRDLWPEFAIDMGVLKQRPLIWAARRLESFLYARADHILVNSPAYRDYLLARGIARDKVSFIANGVDPELFVPSSGHRSLRAEYGLTDKFLVTYAGAMGMANNLEIALEAAALLRDQPNVHFLFVGDGKDRPKLEALARDLRNVTFAGPRPKSMMPSILAESDVGLAVLRDIPMFRTTYPNKVFDYMAAARPVVLAIDGVIREVVEAAGAGIAVPPGNPAKIASAIRELAGDRERGRRMGEAGRAHVLAHFDRCKQAEDFRELVQRMQARHAS